MNIPVNQKKINKIFNDFIKSSQKGESLEKAIKEFEKRTHKALLEQRGLSNASPEEKEIIRLEMKEKMREMNFNNPSLVDAEKMLRSIGASDYKRAGEYLTQLHALRDSKIRKNQTLIAKMPRKADPLTKILADIVKQRPDISSRDAIKLLESGHYADTVIESDEDEITYKFPNAYKSINERYKTIKKSGIPARLTRLRNKR